MILYNKTRRYLFSTTVFSCSRRLIGGFIFASMVNIWFLLYIVDIGRVYYLYFHISSAEPVNGGFLFYTFYSKRTVVLSEILNWLFDPVPKENTSRNIAGTSVPSYTKTATLIPFFIRSHIWRTCFSSTSSGRMD